MRPVGSDEIDLAAGAHYTVVDTFNSKPTRGGVGGGHYTYARIEYVEKKNRRCRYSRRSYYLTSKIAYDLGAVVSRYLTFPLRWRRYRRRRCRRRRRRLLCSLVRTRKIITCRARARRWSARVFTGVRSAPLFPSCESHGRITKDHREITEHVTRTGTYIPTYLPTYLLTLQA